MKRFATALLLVLVAPVFAIDTSAPLQDPAQQARYQALIHELRCLKCQGETVADTQAMFGEDIRRQVREMVGSGKSDADVRQYMVDRYGEIILLRPAWSAQNAWLWLAPALCLLGGAFIAWRILRQRRSLLETDTSEVTDEARP